MGEYLRSPVVRVGLALLVFGSGPLVAIILLAAMGALDDPNPNPVGPGILAGFTFWPGVLTLIAGVISVARRRR